MALNNRKYAALPDLDSSPDIYETPDLTDDNSTVPAGTVRSHSSTSSYKDFEDEDDDNPSISRLRLHPDEARSHFSPARIDARDVDFSDRVNGKRKSYKSSSRRQKKRDNGTEVLGDVSDEDGGESFERKLARLRREIEEVKEEFARRGSDKRGASTEPLGKDGAPDEKDIDALSKLLGAISTKREGTGQSAGTKLAKSLGSGLPPQATTTSLKGSDFAADVVSHTSDFQHSDVLASAADFDNRLLLLEKALGITSLPLPPLDPKGVPMAVIPTLDKLHRQVSALADATPMSLDAINRRVRALTQESEKLAASRTAAKAAQDALTSGFTDTLTRTLTALELENLQQTRKVNAIYEKLNTIEEIAPLLPGMLDRLRSLRAIHTDAAAAGENLDRVAKKQEEMAVDIKKWREGLERVEQAMKKGEGVMGENMKVVEGWVKDLEERMANF